MGFRPPQLPLLHAEEANEVTLEFGDEGAGRQEAVSGLPCE